MMSPRFFKHRLFLSFSCLLFVFAVLITVRRVSATAWRNGADDGISSESAAVRQAPKLLIPGEHGVGRYMANLEFFDLQGTSTTLHINPSPPLTVVAFTSTSCPLSRKYLPTLVELHREFSARGIRFILVNCIATDEADDMREAAAKFTTNIEYVPDPDSKIAAHLNAASTTDVFVLDRSMTVIYHGAIDDQYGFGYAIDAPRQTWLRDALEAGLSNRPVLVSATAAPGCVLQTPRTATASSEVTWHNQVSRLLQRHCVECHRDGGVAPFPLDTLEDAIAHAPMIREVVARGSMPPWFAAKDNAATASPWINDRSLSSSEKQQLAAWLDNGMPAGDPVHSPIPRTFADGWLIGKPDVIYQFSKPVRIKASGTMPYQQVFVDTFLEQDQWVQAIEVQPGNRGVVHHVLVFVQDGDDEPNVRDDAADERGGYWGIYVPGNSTLVYPEGYAKKIPKNARLRFQMHYTPNGTETEDATRIGLVFAKQEPKYEVRVAGVVNHTFRIPPGADNHPVVGSIRNIPADIQVLGFLPHMHLRGKAARYELISGGQTRTLLNIPHYDFNWQLLYRYAEPLSVKAGDTLQFTAWYDNSSGNPANPDPTREVRWGPQTTDEMHLGYVEYIVPGAKPGDRNPLARSGRLREALRNGLRGTNAAEPRTGVALFRQLDTDNSGGISRDEVKARFPNPAASTIIFDRLDTDASEDLSPEEFQRLPSRIAPGSAAPSN